MKKLLFFLLLPALAVVALPSKILLHVDTYKVDVNSSKVEWFAEKVTGKHNGTIKISKGDITSNHGKMGGSFVIDMTTIAVSDLPDDKKGKLESHLKSEDFFGVAKYPESKFEILSVAPIAGNEKANFNVTGNLTIKGITKEITFPALIKFEENKLLAKADVVVDRTKFDVRYGSKTFFEDIGDKAIYDEFTLKIDLVAVK